MKIKNMTRRRPLDGYVKSSFSDGGGQCVLVRRKPDEESIFIRDSKYLRDPSNVPDDEPILEMPSSAWAGLHSAALGELTAPPLAGQPCIEEAGDGGVTMRGADETALTFTADEWSAFLAGLTAGEFELRPIAA